ncbi:hypothetical protein [Phycisphaera mikurensis]|uniref:Uncharacterized protein n=1 Tax=Phycisphaera mikurensis (strain NBRC 102666 / KCTC 22515 / FYK2301M01) TaxID=1142394 RepID=I0IFW2_PHYMF|nr:hypothetical protein [Phycisphaera mikurensis]MBB6440461.1 hypothetical protein [Phycisphaera mikurensis]BAM04150.1 hypothetical protein PSMK_19910 [Phycisphaera mikurensis NBRC 102666]
MRFTWTDAVILTVICDRNESGGSSYSSILTHGDFYARCILTDLEYFGGLHRLIAAGHIYLDDELLFAEDGALDYYSSPPDGLEYAEQLLEHMMAFLGVTWAGT